MSKNNENETKKSSAHGNQLLDEDQSNANEQPELKDDNREVKYKYSKIASLSIAKVVGTGLITTLFLGSVLLNFSYILEDDSQIFAQSATHWVLIFGLICITIISLIISFWNYHIRSVYLKDGPALVPERWGRILSELIDVWKLQHNQSQSSLSRIQKYSEEQTKRSNDLLESFLTLQDALTLRDEEISRLKKGYDSKIFKRFLMRFVRVDRSLKKIELEFTGNEHEKNYKYLVRLMRDALEECGVEQFIPEVGTDYRDAGPQIADDPVVIETEDADKDFKIADIESAGYVLVGEGETEVVIPSRVSIYRVKSLLSEEDE